MVEEAIADKSWLPWVECLIPNVSHQLREVAEAKAQVEQDCKVQEEAQHIIEENLARAAKQNKQLEEKLMEVLEGRLTQEAEEIGEAEGSEAVRTTGGTQSLVMEVNEEEGDEVVVVEEVKRGEMRKQALSSPPKSLRKRVRAGTATQTLAGSQVLGSSVQGSQVGLGNAGSMAKPCWRCVKHQVQCIVAAKGA